MQSRKIVPRAAVVNDHEAHDAGHGSPHEVQGAVAYEHAAVAVDRTGCARELMLIESELVEADLLAVDPGSSPGAARCLGHWHVSDGVALGAREQMMLRLQQGNDDLGARVVGVGDKQDLPAPATSDRKQECDEFVQEGP